MQLYGLSHLIFKMGHRTLPGMLLLEEGNMYIKRLIEFLIQMGTMIATIIMEKVKVP
jgi:hypothetical protein